MQKDKHLYDIITRYILGQITEEESKELDRWAAESPHNKQLLDSFLESRDMSRLFNIPASHKDAETTFGNIHTTTRHLTPITRSMWYKVAAAVILLIIGVTWWNKYTEVVAPQLSEEYVAAMSMSQKAGRSDADIYITGVTSKPLATATNVQDESGFNALLDVLTNDGNIDEKELQAQVVTHHDKEFWLTLPDGTRVHLNYGCRLTYPLQFTGDKREVTLEGEAYFLVAKDKRHPFIVHTQYGDVKEYGTEFVVNTRYKNDANGYTSAIKGSGVSVVLIEGSISVIPDSGKERMMKPNDMALLNGSSTIPEIKQVDTTPFVAWNTGTFAFDNCPLEQLLEVISRWYDIKVEYVGEDSHHLSTFTGELDRYNDVTSGVRAISRVTGLTIKIVDNTIVVE